MSGVFVTGHGVERFRFHWEPAKSMSDDDIIRTMKSRIEDALAAGKKVETPGGTYVPVTLEGVDGYAVLQGTQVVTFAPLAWCEEVNQGRDFF